MTINPLASTFGAKWWWTGGGLKTAIARSQRAGLIFHHRNKLLVYLRSWAQFPCCDGGAPTDALDAAATAFDDSIRRIQIHYGKGGFSIGVKPIDRSGHRVKGAHALVPTCLTKTRRSCERRVNFLVRYRYPQRRTLRTEPSSRSIVTVRHPRYPRSYP